jgi:hypothetical protein
LKRKKLKILKEEKQKKMIEKSKIHQKKLSFTEMRELIINKKNKFLLDKTKTIKENLKKKNEKKTQNEKIEPTH